ncbi:DEAD/DEAH box helicase (plasmid) [Tundrisphaera sp. TA3]|uniref:DEAD/DEAH box helicase n=1 Tax=Tundrisphaera sp. TA3 TaxID=3435775 RepID=UPI003EBE8658
MVDFSKLLNEDESPIPIEPGELFQSLVREPAYEYVRSVQTEVLDAWFARRDEQDAVIKMNTGAGKTMVGLLMLQSSLNEGVSPAIYLCPTKQLVEQVVAQAKGCGIQTVEFGADREMPPEFLNGEAILVTTFQKLFNGRTVFGIPGSGRQPVHLGAVLIDDAHSCLSIARETVSITLAGGSSGYESLRSLFRPALETQSMGTAATILNNDPRYYMAVPYWAWMTAHASVARILSDLRETEPLRFSWDLIKDDLEMSHCVIAGHKLEITPHIIPIERIPSFTEAKRRFFLSATLVDDSVLLKEFGVSESAVNSTIKPKARGDIGERMIVAPRLVHKDLTRDNALTIASAISKSKRNAVVLVSSKERSKYWEDNGAIVAMGESVGPMVSRLLESTGNFAVLVNRYDGIDLPGSACRLLIMDGLPAGMSLYEQHLMSVLPNSPQQRANMAQKIEQGLGRGVRSGSDYCVVLLTGVDLVAFITRRENHAFLSPETRRQIEIGQELAKVSQQEVGVPQKRLQDLVIPCINQDGSWKRYHAHKMTNLDKPLTDEVRLKLAAMERAAVEKFRSGSALEGASIIQKVLSELKMSEGPDFGWYLQLAANLTQKIDPARAQEMQRKAHEANRNLFRPIDGIKYQKLASKAGLQANRVLAWVRGHTDSNAIPVAMAAMLSNLSFGVSFEDFEKEWAHLADVLGFAGQRPEKEFGNGPDILWNMTDGYYLVQEAKSEVELKRKTVHKSEAGQLSVSVNWFKQTYGEGTPFSPILIHPATVCHEDAFAPEGTLVHDGDSSAKLHRKLTEFAAALASKAPEAWSVEEISELLSSHSLTPSRFRKGFFKPLESAR